LGGSWVDLGGSWVDLGWILVDLGWILVDLGGSWVDNEMIFSQQLGVLSKRKLLVSIPSQIAHLHGFACRSEIKWELNPQVVG
jgi:hypothetical protein